VGYEQSEQRMADVAAKHILATFSYALKHKQPHPNPPLLWQGRELIAASIKMHV
jgi:hypothetical protein